MRNAIDITIIAVYLIGTVIFGCSFFWKKKRRGSGADAQQRVPPEAATEARLFFPFQKKLQPKITVPIR